MSKKNKKTDELYWSWTIAGTMNIDKEGREPMASIACHDIHGTVNGRVFELPDHVVKMIREEFRAFTTEELLGAMEGTLPK